MAPKTRKQRQQQLIDSGIVPPARKKSVPSKPMMERKSIPAGYVSPGNSPFLKKLPREVRDKIYDELLIVQRSPADEAKCDKLRSAITAGHREYECERELDIMAQSYLLIPDLSQPNLGTQFIGKNKGILLANKQIWDEATDVLFGKNIFGAVPQTERIQAFWRCGMGCQCTPTHRPCQARPETFAKIKHIFFLVSVIQPDSILGGSRTTTHNLKVNLQTIVDTFRESGNHLLTATLRYWSHFGGEFEAVRESLEGPLPAGMEERPLAQIRHAITGRFHYIDAAKMGETIFKDIHILDSLKTLKGIVDYVDIRGDIPARYRDELRKIMSATDPGLPGKKMRKAEVEAANTRRKPVGGGSLASFAAEMIAKDPDNPKTRELWQELTKVPTRSPAVMATIFPELYDGSIPSVRNQGGAGPETASSAPASSSATTPAGGIGTLHGKPIFGPVRPPGDE